MPADEGGVVGTARRVEEHSPRRANAAIRGATRTRLANVAHRPGRAEAIDQRLDELDREWDIERALELLSASFTLGGLGMAWSRRDMRWLVVPLVVQGFFLQHAVQGWCPPLPLLRRMGFRTVREIETERRGLLALRETALGRREPLIPRGEEMP